MVAAIDVGTRAQTFYRCPWGIALGDREVGAWLRAYWYCDGKPHALEPWMKADPRTVEAIAVIGAEHAKCQREEYDRMAKK